MSWKDLQARFMGLFAGKGGQSTRRPDGGTSCYRPVQRRNSQEEKLAREKAAEYAASQPQVPYVHTGFTGMNPPSEGNPPVQSTYAGDSRGYAGMPAWPDYAGYGAQGAQPEARGGYPPQQQEQPLNNISYMPGYGAAGGSTYTHVDHLMAITSLRSCYEAIECMKNGETLILTLDVLGSEGERTRCQDMLAGAAFTLQCTVRMLNGPGLVVIAPAGVKLLPEQQPSRRYGETEEYAQPVQPQAEEYVPRRERRVSRNAVGWDQAQQTGGQGINPYTGSMPAAAGAYGAYGGYM